MKGSVYMYVMAIFQEKINKYIADLVDFQPHISMGGCMATFLILAKRLVHYQLTHCTCVA